MSTRHSVTVRGPRDTFFECASCGFAAHLRVQAYGRGSATSFIVIDRAHARERAADAADVDAKAHARTTAAILPCPRCHERSRAAVVWFALVGAVATLGLAAIGGGLLVVVGGAAGLACAGVFGAIAGSVGWQRWRHYQRAPALVEGMAERAALPVATAVVVPPLAVQPSREPERIEAAPVEGGPRTLR